MGSWVDGCRLCTQRVLVEDDLQPNEQLDLEKAFAELMDGLKILIESGENAAPAGVLFELLSKSLTAYRLGNDIKGAHLLQDFASRAFVDYYESGPV